MSRHVKNGGGAVITPRNNRRDNDVISYREFFVNSKNTLYYLICLQRKFTKNSYKITAKLMRKWNVSIGLKYNISIACCVRANNKCVDVTLGIYLQCIPKNSHFVKTIFCTMTQKTRSRVLLLYEFYYAQVVSYMDQNLIYCRSGSIIAR